MTARKPGDELTDEEVGTILTEDLWTAACILVDSHARLKRAGVNSGFDPVLERNFYRIAVSIVNLIGDVRALMDDPDPAKCDVEAVKEVQAKLRAIAADLAPADQYQPGRGNLT